MTLDDAEAFAVSQGWAKFRGEQVWRWVHAHGARSFEEMSNLNRQTRARLAEVATIGTLTIAEVQTSSDGTRKLRLVTRDGQSIESVLIPDGEKTTQCISSQVGCAVDCQFCATAKLGLVRNLDAGEIVGQVYLARRLLAEVARGRGGRGGGASNFAGTYRDFGGVDLPAMTRLTISTPWQLGVPVVGVGLISALVLRRPRPLWPYVAG